jgi:ABC-2 type transport system ATP-binding protein
VLLTTQYLEEADRLADRIAVVDHGRIVANDTSARLKAHLAGTVIEIGMETEERAGRAHEVLVAAVADHPQRDGTMVRLTSNAGPSALIDTLRLLDAHELKPATLAVHEPTLDDAFLALTGRRAEGAEQGGGDRTSDGERSRDAADRSGEQAAAAPGVVEAGPAATGEARSVPDDESEGRAA